MCDYWRVPRASGKGLLECEGRFCDSLAKLMVVMQNREKFVIAEWADSRHTLFLDAQSFFPKKASGPQHVGQQLQFMFNVSSAPPALPDDERKDRTKFLARLYDLFCDCVHAGIAKHLSQILTSKSWTPANIAALMRVVTSSHMAYKMASSTRNPALLRLCFVGVESIGKSTLINYLVNPDGDGGDCLPASHYLVLIAFNSFKCPSHVSRLILRDCSMMQ